MVISSQHQEGKFVWLCSIAIGVHFNNWIKWQTKIALIAGPIWMLQLVFSMTSSIRTVVSLTRSGMTHTPKVSGTTSGNQRNLSNPPTLSAAKTLLTSQISKKDYLTTYPVVPNPKDFLSQIHQMKMEGSRLKMITVSKGVWRVLLRYCLKLFSQSDYFRIMKSQTRFRGILLVKTSMGMYFPLYLE